MRPKNFLMALFVLLCVSVAVSLSAQLNQSATGQSTSTPPEEHKVGDYVAAGSIEAGYRFVDVSGAQFPCQSLGTIGQTCNFTGLWSTFEDLRQGPRVFEQSLSLRSIGQTGVLFDNLFVSSFGWGGDPQNVARVRVSKHKLYNFAALFRRNYQRFNMNVLANPLNPPTSTPNVPIFNSPHTYDTARRMTDLNLTLAPASPITVRLGYDRNRVEGPALTSFHMPMGTDINPVENWNTETNGFRAGVDLKFIPKTTLSFDAVVHWFKNDGIFSNPFLFWNVGGVPADLGVSWNTQANQPCAVALVGTPACNLDFTFFRQDRVRSTMPNLFASLESHYWRKFDVSTKFTYGWADYDSVYDQIWNGFAARPKTRQQAVLNTPHNRRISNGFDFGITYHVTDRFRISDSFRYVNQKMPRSATNILTTSLGATDAFSPLGVPTVAGTGQEFGLFDNSRSNEVDAEFDFARYGGATLGYRYTRRYISLTGEGFDIDVNSGERDTPFEPGEVGFDHYRIPEHTGLGSLWIQPSDKFRLNFDAEFTSAGITTRSFSEEDGVDFQVNGQTSFTRILPRHQQQYRARATLKPMLHVVMTGSANILEQRNSLTDIQYRMHNRNYGFNADISPNDRLLLDIGYNYQDYLQNNLICFIGPVTAAGAFPGPAFASAGTCLTDPAYLTVNGKYTSQVHFGDIMLRVKPVKRATLSLGYSIVSTDGAAPITYAFIPVSPLQFNYHRPLAAVEIELAGGLALKGGYNYYDYNEKGSSTLVPGSGGPTSPRDFHTNTGTIALRYTF